ncbi:MAG: hypothetical protein QME50_07260 [Candidatus Bathyarchaeota archaeon]|nr:hypothetical protein [Candidatus Bathyarchaeota archaeon]
MVDASKPARLGCGNRFFKIRRGISAITEKFFVDTTVFVAAFNVRDKFHELGLKLKDESNLKSIMRPENFLSYTC